MPHFFINSEQVNGNKISISDKENYIHIARALRARAGEKLLLIDEKQTQYETTILQITNSEILAEINNSYKSKRFLDFELYLAQSPLRSDAQALLIEKATELGVTGVYPVMTDNCAVNKSVAEKKVAKWQKIMYEASKQCERAIVPECYEVSTIEKVISENHFDKIIRDCFIEKPIQQNEKVLVIIGPEGGFSQKEFDYFKTSGFEMLTLGNLILKADTAVVVALGNIIYEYSNFKK